MASTLSSLATLLKQTHINDDEEVLRAADAALKQSRGDPEAQHVKVVALLKLDRFEEALKTLEAGGEQLRQRASLEYSYALYKAGKPQAAVNVAKNGSTRGLQHVEAQAEYRNEHFERAADLYNQLGLQLEDDAEADIRTNAGAVDSQLEWTGRSDLVRKKKLSREDLDAFEAVFNAACGSIARGELAQAEVLLRRAKDLCKAIEDLSEEEKQAELLPITVQQIYVLTRLGRMDEAEALAQRIDVRTISSSDTQYVARLNTALASTAASNPFLTQRLVSEDPHILKANDLFSYQSAIISENRFASDLQSLKYSGTATSTHRTISKHPSPSTSALLNTLSVVNAAAHAKNQTGKEALKHILPILENRPGDIGLVLTVVQLYQLTGNSIAAVNLIESFLSRLERAGDASNLDVRYAPGLVGAVVSFHAAQGRKAQIRSELAKAANHWRSRPERSFGILNLLKSAGAALLESEDLGHQQLAHEVFTELSKHEPNDRYAAAGLLAAAESSQITSDQSTTLLTPIPQLISGINVDALEGAGIAQLPSAGAAASARKRPAEDKRVKKAKKARRLPKNYDPSKAPDPERWLPLRDRSTYRPKGKKGKARQALLSQGAVTTEGDGSRPATPGGEVVKQKQGTGGGANKKKKGKGGKW